MTTAVVVGAFDAAGDGRIEALRDAAEARGLSVRRSHRPHLTLSAARVDDPAVVIAAVADVASRHRPVTLTSTGLGRFEAGVVYVAFEPSPRLVALQRDVHATLAAAWPPAFGASSDPNGWVAHCTVALRVPRSTRVDLAPGPFDVTVDALAVIAVGGRGDLARLPLTG